MNQLKLKQIKELRGDIELPGSKSLSNRALLIASLSNKTTKITNLLDSDDVKYMLEALKEIGVEYELSQNKKECIVKGVGKAFETNSKKELYLGNAGTAMRPLCAVLSFGKGEYVLTGEPRMKERPIKDLVDSLKELGADIEYLENVGYPPLKIKAKELNGQNSSINGTISSQFLTALLIASPLNKEDLTINIKGELVSKPYIDITLNILKEFGVNVTHNNYKSFFVKSGQNYIGKESFLVEGDASSASYFLAGASINGEVTVKGVGKNSTQGEVDFAKVLEQMGAIVEWGDDYIKVKSDKLNSIDIDCNHITDTAMTLATLSLFAKGTTTLRNIYNWRVKETDRLYAMATELRKVGAKVVEGEDYLEITPPKELKHSSIDTYNDHRIAMAFSLLAFSPNSITINEPECTSKTFPTYFEELEKISIFS